MSSRRGNGAPRDLAKESRQVFRKPLDALDEEEYGTLLIEDGAAQRRAYNRYHVFRTPKSTPKTPKSPLASAFVTPRDYEYRTLDDLRAASSDWHPHPRRGGALVSACLRPKADGSPCMTRTGGGVACSRHRPREVKPLLGGAGKTFTATDESGAKYTLQLDKVESSDATSQDAAPSLDSVKDAEALPSGAVATVVQAAAKVAGDDSDGGDGGDSEDDEVEELQEVKKAVVKEAGREESQKLAADAAATVENAQKTKDDAAKVQVINSEVPDGARALDSEATTDALENVEGGSRRPRRRKTTRSR